MKLSEQELLANPAISFWLKDQIRHINQRDVLDALRDAELWVELLQQRFNRQTNLQGTHGNIET
jgi:hypothetical protein